MHIVYVLGLSDEISSSSFKQTTLYLNKTISKCNAEYSIVTPSILSDGEMDWCSDNKSCHDAIKEINYENEVISSKNDPEYECFGRGCSDNCTKILQKIFFTGSRNIFKRLQTKVTVNEKQGVLIVVGF